MHWFSQVRNHEINIHSTNIALKSIKVPGLLIGVFRPTTNQWGKTSQSAKIAMVSRNTVSWLFSILDHSFQQSAVPVYFPQNLII